MLSTAMEPLDCSMLEYFRCPLQLIINIVDLLLDVR